MPKNKVDMDEGEFQKGIRDTGWFKEYVKEYGEEPDLDTKDYDYRAAWNAGVRPERDKYDKGRYHWGSSDPKTGKMLKSEDHPTAWKENYMRETGKNPDEVGITKEQYMQQKKPKMAKGGMVNQTKRLLKDGGMMQEGGTVDPVSGNKVPVGAMQEEVRDDVPAQLSEGEFVFPADVVRYIGLERLMQMRQVAKEGLMKMEDMGQMSNGEEGDEEEDTAEFESQLDEIMGEMGNEEEEVKMAMGGAVVPPPATQPMSMTPMGATEVATQMPSNPLQDMQRVAAAPASSMTTSQIVKQDMGTDPKKAQELLSKVAMNKAVLLRDSDTVFVGEAITPGSVKLHTFTADTPEKLPEATLKIVDTMKQSGVKEITGDVKDEAVVTALKDAGYNPEVMESPEGGSTYSVKLEEMV
jgi:hypothetical protein